MKINVIINTKTLRVETEAVFRKRWSNSVSFNGPLTKQLVSQLEPDSILQELPQTPIYDDRYQLHYMSDPVIKNGVPTVSWVVGFKSRGEINLYVNSIVEEWIDYKAVERGYSNQDRMIGYIGDPNPVIDQEARYMKFWRSLVWNQVIPRIETFLNTIGSSNFKPISISDLVSGVPEFSIPANF